MRPPGKSSVKNYSKEFAFVNDLNCFTQNWKLQRLVNPCASTERDDDWFGKTMVNFQVEHHLTKRVKAFCDARRALRLWRWLIRAEMSSTNIRTITPCAFWSDLVDGKLHVITVYKRGLSTAPWGTPIDVIFVSECLLATLGWNH